eukprot:12897658-Alexandrium_andersonii.AAC.1
MCIRDSTTCMTMHVVFRNLDGLLNGTLGVLGPCGEHAGTKLAHRCCMLSDLDVGHFSKHIEDPLVG